MIGAIVYTLSGDYNRDGIVDAADYTVWRDSLGQPTVAGTGADGNFNGTIDHEDYRVWKSHFGSTRPPAAASAQGANLVPEPTSNLVGFVPLLVGSVCGRRFVAKRGAGEFLSAEGNTVRRRIRSFIPTKSRRQFFRIGGPNNGELDRG